MTFLSGRLLGVDMRESILEDAYTLIGLPPYLGRSALLHLPPRRFFETRPSWPRFFYCAYPCRDYARSFNDLGRPSRVVPAAGVRGKCLCIADDFCNIPALCVARCALNLLVKTDDDFFRQTA